MKNLQDNLWKIRIYKFLSDFLIIAPVLVPFYKSNGLTSTQFFIVQSLFSLMLLAFEIPTGFISDVIGRKKTMLIGAAALPVGILIYAVSSSFWYFVLAELFFAIAIGMKSGSDSAILYDTLKVLKRENEYKKHEGTAGAFERSGTAISSLLGGVLALISLRLPFYANFISALFLFFAAMMLMEPERTKWQVKNPIRDILSISKYAVLHKKILSIMLLSSAIFTTGVISIWGYFIYFSSFNTSLVYYGVFFAVFQFASAIGLSSTHLYEKMFGKKNAIFSIAIIPVVFLLMGTVKLPVIFLLAFVNSYLWGMSYPIFMDKLNSYISSDMRATVLSVSSMIGRLTYIVLAPVFGKITDLYSVSYAFIFLFAYFVVMSLVSGYFWFKKDVS